MKKILILACASLLTFACSKKEVEETSASTPAPPQQAPAPVEKAESTAPLPELSPEEPTTELGDAPVAADLEEEATSAIALDNLDLEIDRLEAEIEG